MKKQGMRDRMDEGEGMMKAKMGGKAHYENEVEEPEVPMQGHMASGMGLHEFKGEADPIAYGQAGMEGCRSDEKKIMAQMKDYHWD